MDLSPDVLALVNQARLIGCTVYMHPTGAHRSFYYTDGKNIGYCEVPRRRMPTLTTVHKPNRSTGTGFQFVGPGGVVDMRAMDACMRTAIPMAFAYDASVRKYDSWDEFHNASDFNRGYIEA